VNALIALVIIGVLWIAINKVLTASLRYDRYAALSARISALSTPTATSTSHEVPDNRPTNRFPRARTVSHLDY
jgi:hypothetical protein